MIRLYRLSVVHDVRSLNLKNAWKDRNLGHQESVKSLSPKEKVCMRNEHSLVSIGVPH